MIVRQNSFADGMDLLSADVDVSTKGYRWLMNARQRNGEIVPNNASVKLVGAPTGKKLGIASIGNITILFVAETVFGIGEGHAYWNEDGTTQWTLIPGFKMNDNVMYWTQSVPASTFNFTRKLATTANIKDPLNVSVNLSIAGTPSGLLVQDGINQPWIIFYDYTNKVFTARVTQGYSGWTQDNPEYVPIGKAMMMLDQILFIQSKDGRSINRSITGMPLNFMLNVDVNGNKAPTEAQGGAQTTSFAFDFDEITNLTAASIPSSFIYGTGFNIRVITADYNNTIFGEPSFFVSASIVAGIVNQYSVIELNGDYAFIDAEGVKSFNAVRQLKVEGRNSDFSKQLNKVLKDKNNKPIKQADPLAISFNNYGIFALQSSWGFLYFVYDSILDKWTGFDSISAGRITRVTSVDTETETKLYAINDKDEVWWLYSNTTKTEVAVLATRPYSTIVGQAEYETDLKVQHKSQQLNLVIRNSTNAGTLTAIEYVDDQLSSSVIQVALDSVISGFKYPIIPPVIPNSEKLVENKTVSLRDGLQGRKIAYILKWDNSATLRELQLTTTEFNPDVAGKQSSNTLN